ncbi:MAG: hypothetical protein ACI9BW_004640 [Gammaproteobacteria bacterium]|jgi:hypothetical protein
MTINRRTFLAYSSASLAAMPLHTVRAGTMPGYTVVVDEGVPESMLFADGFSRCRKVFSDLAAPRKVHDTITSALSINSLVFGCTQESTTFVLAELLRGSALSLQVLGRHRQHNARTLDHQIRSLSDVRWASVLAREDWPRRMGEIFGDIPATGITQFETIRANTPKLLGSPGYVSSWQIVGG